MDIQKNVSLMEEQLKNLREDLSRKQKLLADLEKTSKNVRAERRIVENRINILVGAIEAYGAAFKLFTEKNEEQNV